MTRGRLTSVQRAVWLALWFVVPASAHAQSVGVATAMVKVRPDTAVPSVTEARIEAARNEVEPFQVVIGGGGAGVTGVRASVSALSGPSGASIGADRVVVYRAALYDVVTASSPDGATGLWPDPLVPDVDQYFGETRNAFPFDVPAGESRAIWIEVFVPPGTPPGEYTGSVSVTGSGLTSVDVPVHLRVRGFDLPSTSTLPSAFGMSWNAACVAHRGSYAACGDSGVEMFHVLYARAALDHRVSIESVVYAPPSSSADWDHFASVYGGLLEGTAGTRLEGARLTTMRTLASTESAMTAWRDQFASRGWSDVILFDYTCDEPPAGCLFSEIPTLAAAARAAGIPVLITTDIDEATSNGLLDTIDIMTPVVNFMDDRGGSNRRPDYDAFLSREGDNRLWWYQSCMSHGCGDGCVATTDDYFTGWPSYMVDASAMQNRAMEWLSFRYDVSGELYFETTYDLPSAWDDLCDFSGNGDGTLFYPGTPARIGGSSDIPIESIRLKLIREGMEDYEYLHLLATLGDRAMAESEAQTLFPTPYSAGAASGDALYAARSRIADRIEELMGTPPERAGVDVPRAPGAVTIDGALDEFGSAPTQTITGGGASATFRFIWDQSSLYMAVEVSDPDLRAPETGRDGMLWESDAIELMIDPLLTRTDTPDTDDRHVIVSAKDDLLDANGAGAAEDRSADLGVTWAVIADGTLDDATADTGWRAEIAIPWSALSITPAAGARLGADVALDDASGSGLEYADWAGLTTFAVPSRWNELRLLAGTTPPPDGGPQSVDGGQLDGGMQMDGGTAPAPGGCGCRAIGGSRSSGVAALFAIVIGLALRRRR